MKRNKYSIGVSHSRSMWQRLPQQSNLLGKRNQLLVWMMGPWNSASGETRQNTVPLNSYNLSVSLEWPETSFKMLISMLKQMSLSKHSRTWLGETLELSKIPVWQAPVAIIRQILKYLQLELYKSFYLTSVETTWAVLGTPVGGQ